MFSFLKHGAFLLLSLSREKVAEPSACQMPVVWIHFQANCYELPGILHKASGAYTGASDCFQCDDGRGGGNLFPRKG